MAPRVTRRKQPPNTARLRKAVEQMSRAKQQLARARDEAARASPVGSPAVYVDRKWREAYATLERNRARLLAVPGVVGFGVGYRRRGGELTKEPCIIVSVRAKWSPARLRSLGRKRIPRTLLSSRGRRIPVDVLPVGRLRLHLLAGTSMGRMQPPTRGTIGAFAIDLETRSPVALTAMHVSDLNQYPPGGPVAFTAPSRLENGSRPLGLLRRGTRHGVDAMKVSVAVPGIVEPFIKAIGRVRGWRPVSVEADRGTAVRMFGARSQLQLGRIEEPFHSLPEFGLNAAILVRIDSQPGDSGAAIVDNRNLVLGLLAGELTAFPGMRAFSPIGAVLSVLRCNIPSTR